MRTVVAALAAMSLVLALAAPAGIDERPGGAVPAGIDGRPPHTTVERGPDGLLMLAVNPPERALLADPVTGRTTERKLPSGTLCHGPLLAVGDRIAYIGSRRGAWVALSAPLRRTGRARLLGRADTITPSATPGRIWLGRRSGRRLLLRDVDARGREFARARIPGRPETLAAVVRDGFLTTTRPGFTLRSPQLGRPLVRIGDAWVVATHAERFAWCREPCRRLHVWSPDGESVLETAIRPQLAVTGAFSPDGKRLALPVVRDGYTGLAVVDLEHHTWTVVPRGRHSGYAALAWSPSGRWLYFAGRGGRVLASRGGSERAVRLAIRTRGTVMSISTRARKYGA